MGRYAALPGGEAKLSGLLATVVCEVIGIDRGGDGIVTITQPEVWPVLICGRTWLENGRAVQTLGDPNYVDCQAWAHLGMFVQALAGLAWWLADNRDDENATITFA